MTPLPIILLSILAVAGLAIWLYIRADRRDRHALTEEDYENFRESVRQKHCQGHQQGDYRAPRYSDYGQPREGER